MTSSQKSDAVSSHSIEVLQDVTIRVKQVYDILNCETNRLCKEKEVLDKAAKTFEQNPFPKIVKLDVGGHIFMTSRGGSRKFRKRGPSAPP